MPTGESLDYCEKRESYSCPRPFRLGKCLTAERQMTEYCSELYNHKINGDLPLLNCPQTDTEDDHTILHKEVRLQFNHWKNVRRNLSKQVEKQCTITALTTICIMTWQTGEWPTLWTQSLVITLLKNGNLQQCQNYRTISLISHPSKLMLKIMLNRLKLQAKKIIAEEQAGFRAGKSTTEQIFKGFLSFLKNISSTGKTSIMSS